MTTKHAYNSMSDAYSVTYEMGFDHPSLIIELKEKAVLNNGNIFYINDLVRDFIQGQSDLSNIVQTCHSEIIDKRHLRIAVDNQLNTSQNFMDTFHSPGQRVDEKQNQQLTEILKSFDLKDFKSKIAHQVLCFIVENRNAGLYWNGVEKKFVFLFAFLPYYFIKNNLNPILNKSYSVRLNSMTEVMIGHNPSISIIQNLHLNKFTHIVSLLCDDEGSRKHHDLIDSLGIEWVNLPLSGADIHQIKPATAYSHAETLANLLSLPQNKIYVHCSAGLHRTGMITYAALLKLGYEKQAALETLEQMRPITRIQVTQKRLEWIDSIIRKNINI